MNQTNSQYTITPKNKYFNANVSINEYENRQIVGFSFFFQADLTEVEQIRVMSTGRKPSYTAFVVKAISLALPEFSYANGRVFPSLIPFAGPRRVLFKQSDIAVAAERAGEGMDAVAFCDVIRDADQQTLQDITDWLYELSTCDVDTNKQWREFSTTIRRFPGWLANALIRLPCFSPSLWVKYRGGAVLVSSPAKYGIDAIGGTWPWPLSFSFGLVKRRPVVKDDEVVPCPTFTLTMTFDRRFIAGAQAARFYRRVVEILEHAATEMADFLPSGKETTDVRVTSAQGETAY